MCKGWDATLVTLGCLLLGGPLLAQAEKKGDETKSPRPYDYVQSTDQAIAAYQAYIKQNPKQPMLQVMLAHCYITKARETGDASLYDLADTAIRKALELDPKLFQARFGQAVVLSAQHEFRKALDLVRGLHQEDPQADQCLLVAADALLELGRYEQAEKAYDELQAKEESESLLLSRRARLAELRGRTEEALQLMHRAAEEEAGALVSPRARAWYQARLGEMYFNAGRLAEAGKHYEAARQINPKYSVPLAGLGRVRAAEGKLDEAIERFKQAVTIYADLPTLAELGDLYAKTGKSFLAQVNYDRLEQAGLKQPAFARELALFYCNHDRNLPQALELARKDLTVRQDIYAHDTLAWALFKNHQFEEAAKEMREALKLGTKDASLLYHAGMICAKTGRKDQARSYLAEALRLNPHFSVLQAEVARNELEQLGGDTGR
jgi:tetratricopeptide (TPR) repeat protein